MDRFSRGSLGVAMAVLYPRPESNALDAPADLLPSVHRVIDRFKLCPERRGVVDLVFGGRVLIECLLGALDLHQSLVGMQDVLEGAGGIRIQGQSRPLGVGHDVAANGICPGLGFRERHGSDE